MSLALDLYAIDLERFRALLGSGEEAFCAKVLRTIPDAAARLNLAGDADLVKEWKRGVTGLVLGDAGEALSSRQPFDATVTQASGGLSLAFASILKGFAREGLGGPLPMAARLPKELVHRPLFGLESDGRRVRWGALGRSELGDLATLPLIAPIRAAGLDLVSVT
jgi:hypothetical protein